jgi:hypothetical protein
MKKVLLFLSITLFTITAYSQTPVDTADLREKINSWVVPNSNRQITASKVNQLFNGIANLMKAYAVDSAYRINDTLFLVRRNGFNTIKVTLEKDTNFANSDLIFNGDRTHDGNHKKLNLDNFGQLEFKANDVAGDLKSILILDTLDTGYDDFPVVLARENVTTGTFSYIGLDTTRMTNIIQSGITGTSIIQDFRIDGEGSGQCNLRLDSAGDGSVAGQYGIGWDAGVYLINNNSHNGREAQLQMGVSENFHELYTRVDAHFTPDERYTKFTQNDSSFTFEALNNANSRNLDFRLPKLPIGSITDSVLVKDTDGKVKVISGSNLITASNALTKVGNNIKLGGALTENTSISSSNGSFKINITGVNTTQPGMLNSSTSGNGGVAITGTATTGYGVHGVATGTNGRGLMGSAFDGIGVFSSATGVAFHGESVSNKGLEILTTYSATNSISTVSSFSIQTVGTAANGIGGANDFLAEMTNGSNDTAARITWEWTNATASSQTGALKFWTKNNAGNSTNRFQIGGDGKLTASAYGLGNFTGTPATTPVYTSSGGTVERIAPKIYTAFISQSGTSNPVATVLGTNEIGAIVWTRTGSGVYEGTLTGAFTSGKTVIFYGSPGMDGDNGRVGVYRVDANTIRFKNVDVGGGPYDGFNDVSIKIEVYP